MNLCNNDIIIFRNGKKGIYHSGRLLTDNPEEVILNFRFPKVKDFITEHDVIEVWRIDYKLNINSIEKSIEEALENVNSENSIYYDSRNFIPVYFYLTDFPKLKITNKTWCGDKIDCDNYNNFNYYEKYTEILRVLSPLRNFLEFYHLKQKYEIELTDVVKDHNKQYYNLDFLIPEIDVGLSNIVNKFDKKDVINFSIGNYFDSGEQLKDFTENNPEFIRKYFRLEWRDETN